MEKIEYIVGDVEDIGLIPYGATILNAYLIAKDSDSCKALLYMPKSIKYIDPETNKVCTDKNGRACLFFVTNKKWFEEADESEFINLSGKDAKMFETMIKNNL